MHLIRSVTYALQDVGQFMSPCWAAARGCAYVIQAIGAVASRTVHRDGHVAVPRVSDTWLKEHDLVSYKQGVEP